MHRDLKPENILVRPDGQPVIIDFGLALTRKSHRVTYANLTATPGTPEYMAPEQVEGQRGDARTDIYALGIILFEMLAGRPPYEGDNNLAVMGQHLRGDAPRLDKEAPGVSPSVAAIVARCLRRDPKDRYPDVRALVEALDHPETADLSLLERPSGSPGPPPSFAPRASKGVSIAFGLLAIFAALAFLLQRLHR